MTAPIEVSPTSAAAVPDAVLAGVGGQAIQGRSLGQIAWMRLRRDKVAIAGGVIVLLLVLVAIFGPYLVQNPDTYNANLINPTFSRPNRPFGGISLAHPLGGEPVTGRDMLARILVGARDSLMVGVVATVLARVMGVRLRAMCAIWRARAWGARAACAGGARVPCAAGGGQTRSPALAQGFFSVAPMYMIVPGVAIFIAMMAFTLFGDGLRDALDPRSR